MTVTFGIARCTAALSALNCLANPQLVQYSTNSSVGGSGEATDIAATAGETKGSRSDLRTQWIMKQW